MEKPHWGELTDIDPLKRDRISSAMQECSVVCVFLFCYIINPNLKTITAMANEPSNEYSNAISNLMESVGKIGQMQVDLLTNGIRSASDVFEPLSKTSIEIAGNVMNALNQAMQSVSSAIAPKK